MYNRRKTAKIVQAPTKAIDSSTTNRFLTAVAEHSAVTVSENGARKFSTTNSDWIDQFGNLGKYKIPRDYSEISQDCATLWAQDQDLCVRFMIYIRMISRKTHVFGHDIKTEQAQSGAELKHEGIGRMTWLAINHPDVFKRNIGLFLSAGSVKDIFVMLREDLCFHGWNDRKLDWTFFGNLILSYLENSNSVDLIKKYLPQIKSRSSAKTVEAQANNDIAKWICNLLFGKKDYKAYRKLKTSGTAHEWQQLISKRQFDRLDFSKIHGRALSILVKSKFLKNQDLQDLYSDWIGDQTTVKYTGYVHELLCDLKNNLDKLYAATVDKQFEELVQKVKSDEENLTKFIVVRDTSGSMNGTADGTKYSCGDIAKSLGLYFSAFLDGQFSNHWIEFNSDAKLQEWKGSTPSEKFNYRDRGYLGNTNFQSVINLFVKMKREGVEESEFPTGILCISDGEFDPSSLSGTNTETAFRKLRDAGFSDEYVNSFKIVLWNLSRGWHRSSNVKFETFGQTKNVFYMSGYSASNVKFLMNNKIETADDLFNEAMSQEILNLVKIN